MIEEEHFGYIGNKEISKYILKNKQQTRVGILNLAGIIQEFSIVVNSKRKNLVVNFDTPNEYVENNFQICKQIGRVAGRIKGASFELDNMQYTVEANEGSRSEEHTSELQSRFDLVCRLLLEKKNKKQQE